MKIDNTQNLPYFRGLLYPISILYCRMHYSQKSLQIRECFYFVWVRAVRMHDVFKYLRFFFTDQS